MIENIEELKAQLDPEQVLHLIGYDSCSPKYNGDEIRIFCPIHGSDRQRSLSINTTKRLWECHSCHESGDLIKLYEKAMRVDFHGAYDALFGLSGQTDKFKGATREAAIDNPNPLQIPQQVLDSAVKLAHGSNDYYYLKNKKVVACDGLYFGKDPNGNPSLIVPLYNIDNDLQSVQFIHSGGKFYLEGTHSNSAFFSTDPLNDGDTAYLAEGIGTALTIWMAFEKAAKVISFGSAGNIYHVVNALKSKFPQIKLILCLDRSEAAFKQVQRLGQVQGLSYRLPFFEGLNIPTGNKMPDDFNDLVSKCNLPLATVKEQLMIERSFHDLSIKNIEVQPAKEAPKADAMPASMLTDELELDIINYLANTPLSSICTDGFSPNDFDASLFKGSVVKEGKKTVSINRITVNAINELWQGDAHFLPTDIPLRAGDKADAVHVLLQKLANRTVPRADQIKIRLSSLRSNGVLSNIQNIVDTMISGGEITPEKLDLLSNEIEKGQAESNVLHSDEYYLASILEREEEEEKACIETEFTDLNLLLKGGLRGGRLITLQGAAGAGKSTLMIQMKDNLASKGIPVVFVTMEQSRSELKDVSLARIKASFLDSQPANKKLTKEELFELSINKYAQLARNTYTIEGHSHISMSGPSLRLLTISRVRGYVLNVMQQTKRKPILFIDPFQRLSTGYKEIDASEYDKINTLILLIKAMALILDITIIVASDITKDHESNLTGEGAGRGSYMIQHQSDVVITFKESERSAFEAIYQRTPPAKADAPSPSNKSRKGSQTILTEENLTRDQRKILKLEESEELQPLLKNNTDDIYVAAVVSKNRGGRVFSPLFIHQKGVNRFIEVPFWAKVLPEPRDD